MIFSMTGFGKVKDNVNNMLVDVEVKALNSKGFDANIRMPSFLREKEVDIRNLLAKELERGKVDVFINIELPVDKRAQVINQELAINYAANIKALEVVLGSHKEDGLISEVLRMPNVLEAPEAALTEEEWQGIRTVILQAISLANEYRKKEGLGIDEVLRNSIAKIRNGLEDFQQYENGRVEKIRERILTGVRALEGDVTIDNNRLEQELIFYIEKFDLSEEKQRLAYHLTYFNELLDSEKRTKGKKLNFVSQEIGREINTIGSKANNAEIQKNVIVMKDHLEQIKEQLANAL